MLASLLTKLSWNRITSSFSPHTYCNQRNKQGQTRFSSYYEWISMDERTALESEIIRKCLSRSELQCSFLEYRGYKVIYRRYASLFFIVGTKPDTDAGPDAENNENELGMLEFIHSVVEVRSRRIHCAGGSSIISFVYLDFSHCRLSFSLVFGQVGWFNL